MSTSYDSHHSFHIILFPLGLQFDDDYKQNMLIKRERPSIHGFYKIGKIIGDGNFAVVRECRHRLEEFQCFLENTVFHASP